MATQRRHTWTGFEKYSLLCLLCRGIHITGFLDAKEEVEFGRSVSKKKKKQAPVKVDSKKAYMDVSTALNNTVHNRDFQGDIPHKEVALMINEILNENKGAMFVIERQRVGRITRIAKRVFDRGIGFIGDQREWKAGRKDREERMRLGRMSNTVHEANDDAMDIDAALTSRDVSTVADNGWGAFGAENAAIVTQIQTIDAIGDDWGSDAAGVDNTVSQAALGDEWGGSGATALSTTSVLAQVQGVSDEWGGFGNENTTATSTSTQIQAIEDEWSSSAGATSPISPGLLANQTVGRYWTESGGLTSTEERTLFGNHRIIDGRRDPERANSKISLGLGQYQTVTSFTVGSGGVSSTSNPDLVEMQPKNWSGSAGTNSTIIPDFVTSQTATGACGGGTGSAASTTPTPITNLTRSEAWSEIESRTTMTLYAPGQGVGDDWGGFGSTSSTNKVLPLIQSQTLDANLNDFGRDDNTIATDTTSTQTSRGIANFTCINSTAKVLNSMENLWGSSGSPADDPISKTAVDDMGISSCSMSATEATVIAKGNDLLNLWDQPLPSTEKLNAKVTPRLSQDSWVALPSSTKNGSSSGTFSQSDNEDEWSGEYSRSTSLAFQRDVRSMAPSPDITGRDKVLVATDVLEVNNNRGKARTDEQITFNDDGNWSSSMTVDPWGVKILGQVAFSTPTTSTCGESSGSITHPSRRQQSSSEEDSNLASWPTTRPPTPAESIVTCSPSIAKAGINPESLTMLVPSKQNADADAKTQDLGAEIEKQKNTRRG